MSGVLTREAVIDFCVSGMLEDVFLGSQTAENGFSMLKSTVERLFGDPVTWQEVEAAKNRWKAKKESRGPIHPSFWEAGPEPGADKP